MGCSSGRLVIALRIAAWLANIVDLDLIVLLELVNPCIESVHLPNVVLVQLVLILVVVIANSVFSLPLRHPAAKFASELHIGLSTRLAERAGGSSLVVKDIVANRAEATCV